MSDPDFTIAEGVAAMLERAKEWLDTIPVEDGWDVSAELLDV
jgi:hypothetical protein